MKKRADGHSNATVHVQLSSFVQFRHEESLELLPIRVSIDHPNLSYTYILVSLSKLAIVGPGNAAGDGVAGSRVGQGPDRDVINSILS